MLEILQKIVHVFYLSETGKVRKSETEIAN